MSASQPSGHKIGQQVRCSGDSHAPSPWEKVPGKASGFGLTIRLNDARLRR